MKSTLARIVPGIALVLGACATPGRDDLQISRERAEALRAETGRLIVICMDGTWNDATDATNVYQIHQLARAAPPESKVIPYYTEGVGTTLPTKKKGLVFGYGVAKRVRLAHEFLCKTWKRGDTLVLVGFSRGAYQARLLACLIDTVGILHADRISPPEHVGIPRGIYEVFFEHDSKEEILNRTAGDRRKAAEHGQWHPAEVTALVCFDTVAAVGLPRAPALQDYDPVPEFHQRLFPSTRSALHAMALDERRAAFDLVRFVDDPAHDGRLQQVWFAGAHADVGGGYERRGENHNALRWALENLPDEVRRRLGIDPAHFGPLPELHDEAQRSFWRKREREPVPDSRVHPSVYRRLETDRGYAPVPCWWE